MPRIITASATCATMLVVGFGAGVVCSQLWSTSSLPLLADLGQGMAVVQGGCQQCSEIAAQVADLHKHMEVQEERLAASVSIADVRLAVAATSAASPTGEDAGQGRGGAVAAPTVEARGEERASSPTKADQDGVAAKKWWDTKATANFQHLDESFVKTQYAEWRETFLTRFVWQGKRVVDYGIGGGFLGKVLLEQFGIASYTGIDISEKALDMARSTLRSSCRAAISRIHARPFCLPASDPALPLDRILRDIFGKRGCEWGAGRHAALPAVKGWKDRCRRCLCQ
mmetsp:Transcript_75869/g.217131  ORF Transcript_75869/g.217131 Transcript_75869/m.217131 type:complete len:284 (+) Transcript_75869:112-963(+)